MNRPIMTIPIFKTDKNKDLLDAYSNLSGEDIIEVNGSKWRLKSFEYIGGDPSLYIFDFIFDGIVNDDAEYMHTHQLPTFYHTGKEIPIGRAIMKGEDVTISIYPEIRQVLVQLERLLHEFMLYTNYGPEQLDISIHHKPLRDMEVNDQYSIEMLVKPKSR